jgi:hypothetical protein
MFTQFQLASTNDVTCFGSRGLCSVRGQPSRIHVEPPTPRNRAGFTHAREKTLPGHWLLLEEFLLVHSGSLPRLIGYHHRLQPVEEVAEFWVWKQGKCVLVLNRRAARGPFRF